MSEFFISYNWSDAPTARFLRQWLEEIGFSTFMQEFDIPPTSHIPEKMEEGLKSQRFLAVLSENYLNSDYCRSEFGAAFMRDPLNKAARIVIVRIAPCNMPELWSPISRIELLETGGHIRELFLKGVRDLPPVKPFRKAKTKPAAPLQPPYLPPAATAVAYGDQSMAAGRDINYYGEGRKPRGRAKPPADVISEKQGVQLKTLMDEIIELDSASYGAKLNQAALQKKWWGALMKKVPGTTYTNYSQAKYGRAMRWLREQRGRLLAGVAGDEPELSRAAHIRAIHAYLTRNKIHKLSYYAEVSERLGIAPPFIHSTDLSDYDLGRVYQATRRDSKKR